MTRRLGRVRRQRTRIAAGATYLTVRGTSGSTWRPAHSRRWADSRAEASDLRERGRTSSGAPAGHGGAAVCRGSGDGAAGRAAVIELRPVGGRPGRSRPAVGGNPAAGGYAADERPGQRRIRCVHHGRMRPPARAVAGGVTCTELPRGDDHHAPARTPEPRQPQGKHQGTSGRISDKQRSANRINGF